MIVCGRDGDGLCAMGILVSDMSSASVRRGRAFSRGPEPDGNEWDSGNRPVCRDQNAQASSIGPGADSARIVCSQVWARSRRVWDGSVSRGPTLEVVRRTRDDLEVDRHAGMFEAAGVPGVPGVEELDVRP